MPDIYGLDCTGSGKMDPCPTMILLLQIMHKHRMRPAVRPITSHAKSSVAYAAKSYQNANQDSEQHGMETAVMTTFNKFIYLFI